MIRPILERYHNYKAVETLKDADRLPYHAKVLEGEEIQDARRMLARVYADKGVVGPDDLADNGTLNSDKDPYWPHSVYYGVYDQNDPTRLLIASRIVLATEGGIDESLQMHFDDIDPKVAAELRARDAATIGEFAAYVKAEGLDPIESRVVSLFLIREMARDSLEHGVTTWVCGMRDEIRSKYKRLFGPALQRCGDRVRLGSFNSAAFVPHTIEIEQGLERMANGSRWRIGSRAIAGFMGKVYNPATRPVSRHEVMWDTTEDTERILPPPLVA
jgi:hypothetical protein